MKYTKKQQKFVNYVQKKVKLLFEDRSVVAHGIDHITRVVAWSKIIARKEKARSPFLCELAAWLHDIGRTLEEKPGEDSRKHHELSYELLQKWFRQDKEFNFLTKQEKLELLYSVRYHWNNEANKYDTAWILRDADKLDIFGKEGVKRINEIYGNDEERWNLHFRMMGDYLYWLRTKTAKRIVKEKKLMESIEKVYKKFLKSKIQKVEL